MAFVPRVSLQVGGSVQAQAPGVEQVQDQTGQQLQQTGRGLQIAGSGVQRLGAGIKLRNDTARISEADTQYGEYARKRLSSVDGYRSLQGKAAGDGYEQVRKDLEEKREEIGRGLSGDQRVQFDRSAMARIARAQGVTDGHAAHQTSIYTAAQQSSAIKGYAADYVDGLGDPAAMAKSMVLMRRTVESMGDTVGASPEQRKQMMAEAMTGLHGMTLDTLIARGDSQGARDYFNDNGKAMEPAQRSRAQKMVKSAGIADKGQRLSEFIQTKGSDYLDRVDMLDKMHDRGDISIEVRDNAASRLTTATNQQRQETARIAVTTLKEVKEWVAAGNEPTPQMLTALDDQGQQWKLDHWRDSGGAMVGTASGTRRVGTITREELLSFGSREELWDAEAEGKTPEQLTSMTGRWARLRDEAGLIKQAERESLQEDLIKADIDEDIAHAFTRLPGNNKNSKESDDSARYREFSRSLIRTAEQMGKLKGLKVMNRKTFDEAVNFMLAPERARVGTGDDERLLSTMSAQDIAKMKFRLPGLTAQALGRTHLDMKSVSEADMNAADKRLQARAALLGDRAPTISREMILIEVAEGIVVKNQQNKLSSLKERRLGYNLLAARLKRIRNHPDTKKVLDVPRGVSSQQTGDPVPWYLGGTFEVTFETRTREERIVDLVMDARGVDIAGSHGLSDDEARSLMMEELVPNLNRGEMRKNYLIRRGSDGGMPAESQRPSVVEAPKEPAKARAPERQKPKSAAPESRGGNTLEELTKEGVKNGQTPKQARAAAEAVLKMEEDMDKVFGATDPEDIPPGMQRIFDKITRKLRSGK